MENNDIKVVHITKEISTNKEYINNLDISNFYIIGFVLVLIILIVVIIKFRKKEKFVPIITKEEYYKQREELLDYYIDNKNWDGVKMLLKDSSCSKETLIRAKKVLEDLNKMI